MSKKIYLFSLVLLALAFTACSETEETGKYDNWQARNEAFIDSIANAHANTATRGQLDSIHMIAYPGVPIYFKKKTPVGDVSVSAILSCRPFFILIFLRCIKMKHYGFSRKSIWKNLETFP